MTNSPELPKYKFVENVQSKVGKENVEDFYIGMKSLTMFETHFNEFVSRFDRYMEILKFYWSHRDNEVYKDLTAYVDLLLVHIRAMCIENERYGDNYTAQNFLESIGRKDLAENINNVLSKGFWANQDDGSLSVRESIKICSDKYICHHDSININDHTEIETTFARLNDPMFKHNMEYICTQIIKNISSGFAHLRELNFKNP